MINPKQHFYLAANGTKMQFPTYTTIQIQEIFNDVGMVQLIRTRQLNTMNNKFFTEINDLFHLISYSNACPFRVIVLTSQSEKVFSAGLDLNALNDIAPSKGTNGAQSGLHLMHMIQNWQNAFTAIARCRIPVIAAVHGPCIGGGMDLISACDIRICSQSASFSIKEIDLAIAADLGSLQRLPKILGNHSLLREWAYTGRTILASEALTSGLVSNVAETREQLMAHAIHLAKSIAQKSPGAIYGTKTALNYALDHSISDGLCQVAMWNASQLQSEDVMKAATAIINKTVPVFSKL